MLSEHVIYRLCREIGIPYFGSYLCARQGNPRRNIYMELLVQLLHKRDPNKPIRILEIGSWAGGSAITWALALKRHHSGNGSVLCVDQWKPYFQNAAPASGYQEMNQACESGTILEMFQHNIQAAQCDDIILTLRGCSSTALPLLAEAAFDIVYVDGDHAYEAAKKDILNCLPLVAIGGVLCGDDLEQQMKNIDADFARQNAHLDAVTEPSGKWYHPGVTLAVGELLGEVTVTEGFWHIQRLKDEWATLPLPPLHQIQPPTHLTSTPKQIALLLEDYLKRNSLAK